MSTVDYGKYCVVDITITSVLSPPKNKLEYLNLSKIKLCIYYVLYFHLLPAASQLQEECFRWLLTFILQNVKAHRKPKLRTFEQYQAAMEAKMDTGPIKVFAFPAFNSHKMPTGASQIFLPLLFFSKLLLQI